MCRLAFSHANWTYDTFLESLGPYQCLGSDNKIHDHSQDDQEALECTQALSFGGDGCLRSILSSSFSGH